VVTRHDRRAINPVKTFVAAAIVRCRPPSPCLPDGHLTESGNVALEDYRRRLRAVLGGYLAEIADEQVEALATATETLAQLVDVLQQRPAR